MIQIHQLIDIDKMDKKWPTIHCGSTHLEYNDKYRLKVKGWRKYLSWKYYLNVRLATLI